MRVQYWLRFVCAFFLVAFALLQGFLDCELQMFGREEDVIAAFQYAFLICLFVWCSIFIFLKFNIRDFFLVTLLLIALIKYFFSIELWPIAGVMTFFSAIIIGKLIFVLDSFENGSIRKGFLSSIVLLVAILSVWHWGITNNFYQNFRWSGIWYNPNIYGEVVGAGLMLAIGLFTINFRSGNQHPKKSILLICCSLIMMVGLVFSYSRGAWLGTIIGLIFLVWSYRLIKWHCIVLFFFGLALLILFFWGNTSDSTSWYIKRMDFGRPSANHRVVAWRASLEIMKDYPYGVGWAKAAEVYEKKYLPPENGVAAITTNDYLMIGAELSFFALINLIFYILLCFRGKLVVKNENDGIRTACRAGVIVLLVAFWFDGGLFKLPTAVIFWTLLELGANKTGLPHSESGYFERSETSAKRF